MSPRLARSQLSTYTHFHICVRGNNGQNIFLEDHDRIRYLSLIQRYAQSHRLRCFAYCLMTNHAHLLLLSPSIQLLSRAMHALQVAYAVYFGGLEEANVFASIAQEGFVSVVHRPATEETFRLQLRAMLLDAGIPNNVVSAGLEAFVNELAQLVPAA